MLLKQSSSRNLRAKGFKLKHGFQICVILALCIWLLYQVNKSYSKKGAIEGSGSEVSGQGGENRLQILKLGRKGLNPEIEEEEEKAGDDEAELDDEEKKVRDELEDEERKLRENEGDDETDGGELDKAEEQLEDLIGEEDKEE
ncbi:histone acetyltransferase GCN5-like [Ipomoea triloba]|uniref:histone acetyltransferase GCN5-like n=1 Tax=Ipomoea triloba TaxID=35885 RepID=UPI00125DAE4F|nr:histone acetyltransferase GCN5-like [Ipomoea triloba]